MPKGSSSKRERQDEHVKNSTQDTSKDTSQDTSSSKRGGQRSRSASEGLTYDQLYAEAQRRGIHGRSSMNKSELKRSLGR